MKRCGALLLAALLVAPGAHAEPTLWQRVWRPGARIEAKARLRAEQLFEQSSKASGDLELLRELSLGSAALLELSGGARRDPWQAVLLGRVLLDARPGREREAIRLIESGVGKLPDSDFKRASLFDLGVGAMLLGDMERAERALTSALALAWDPDDRSSIHRNRSNARMLAGRLSGAVADARVAVQLARGVQVVALSHFKLGVALERSGDYPQGMQEVARGVAVRLPVPPYPSESVLELPTLRWVPEYDVHYYRALAAMTEATAPGSDEELVETRYESALEDWEQYLVAAELEKDRFVANARRHQQRCLDTLARLRKSRRPAPLPAASGRVR
jgi:tetratricopeptide (TPR) repeat protein